MESIYDNIIVSIILISILLVSIFKGDAMFIGRKKELEQLNALYNSKKFEMLVLYGRRRVGKTKLLTEFVRDKNAIFYVAEENNDFVNKSKFTRIVLDHFNNDINASFEYWEDIFKFIASRTTNEKLIIVIDELPYLAIGNSSFLSILQNVIDHHLLDRQVMLVLCGSSISFMENELVAHKSPIYGRKTAQMKLLPLNYIDSAKFFPEYDVEDLFKAYSVLGGIPHYLLHFDSDISFDENLIRAFLNTVSFLYDEPNNLLNQEFRNPGVYNAIIEAIANGASKMNEISTKIGELPSKTNKYLKSLLDLEIVNKITPIGEKKSKKSIYYLSDNLYNFIYKYIYKNRSIIEQDLGEVFYYKSIKQDINNYYGRIFEDVCMQFLRNKNKQLELEFIVEDFGSWWGSDPVKKRQEEIDIVGMSQNECIYGECKYCNELVGIKIYEKLVERSYLIPKEKRYYYLFSKSGFTKELIELSTIKSNIKLISLEDLYA